MGRRGVLARTVVLDSEGVSKLALDDPMVMPHILEARKRQAPVVASAATLTEVLRGSSRDAGVHRVLRKVDVVPLTRELGRSAGELLGASGLPATAAIDAMVVATALVQQRPVMILTSDPGDLSALVGEAAGIGVLHI
jgi:predicted nucleic acid-binding protein